MHESGIVRNLIHQLEATAREHGARKISSARVWLGALSQLSSEHFREHFDVEACGTLAQGARLEFETSSDPFHPAAQQVIVQSLDLET